MQFEKKAEILKISPNSFEKEGKTISYSKIVFMSDDGDVFDINIMDEDKVEALKQFIRKQETFLFRLRKTEFGTYKLAM